MSVRDVYEPKLINIEGYGCICGFTTGDRRVFQNHLLLMGSQDGRGVHKSLGRINLRTGEIVELPWVKRTRGVRAKQAKREFNLRTGELRKYEEQMEALKVFKKQRTRETMTTLSVIFEMAQKLIEKELQE